jgi:prefoldin subunit 5
MAEKIDNVRKDNEGEISKLSSTIDEVYVSVTQTKEEMAQYVDDKFRAISGEVQQVRKIADEVSKVKATLGELQNKAASVSSNTPQSADSGKTIVRVISTDQQVASTSSGVGANILPGTNGVKCEHQSCMS